MKHTIKIFSIFSIFSILTMSTFSAHAATNRPTPDQYFSSLHWNKKPMTITQARSIWCNTTNTKINCEDLQTFRILSGTHELNRQWKNAQLAAELKQAAYKRQQVKQQEYNKQYLKSMSTLSNREMMIRNSYHN